MFAIVIAAWVTVIFCILATAQEQPHRGKINASFEFDVGGVKFPPGQYILEAVSPSYGMIHSMDGKKEQTLYFEQTGEPVKNPRVIFAKRSNTYFFNAVWAWFGKMQFTGFTPRPDDETQEVPITPIQ